MGAGGTSEELRGPHEAGARAQGGAPHPHGPLVAPLTDLFHLYISIYPENIQEHNRSGVPPPQASVATKNQSGALSGTLPEREPISGVHIHHPYNFHDEEGSSSPSGLRVCTSSYVFDLSLSLSISLSLSCS